MHILLLEVPQLLRDILEHAIQRHGDCELLKSTSPDFRGEEHGVSPDAVILGLQADDDETLVSALLARWPTAQVITVMQPGESVALHELLTRRRPLDGFSPAELMEALRDTVRGRR